MAERIKYIRGGKIYLRPFETADVDFLYESTNNDLQGRKFTGTQSSFQKRTVEDYIQKDANDDTRVSFAIVKLQDDRMVGEVVLNDINRNNRCANFRIWIADRDIGNGYGTEATVLALDYGFGMLNLHRIELDVYEINKRAIHVYEKAGFRREGVKRQSWYFNHEYLDTVVMGILEEEFRRIHKISGSSQK